MSKSLLAATILAAVALGATRAHAQAVVPGDAPPLDPALLAPAPPPPRPRASPPAPASSDDELDLPQKSSPWRAPPPAWGWPGYRPQYGAANPWPWWIDRAPPKKPRPADPMRLAVAGSLTFAGTYLLSVVFGGFVGQSWEFYIPVAGPLAYGFGSRDANAGTGMLGILVSGAQITGIVLAGVGIARVVSSKSKRESQLTVAPIASPGFLGLGAQGSF